MMDLITAMEGTRFNSRGKFQISFYFTFNPK